MSINEWFHIDECHLIMMDNEIVIIRETMMMGPFNDFKNFV
jgi:hypothetical protein